MGGDGGKERRGKRERGGEGGGREKRKKGEGGDLQMFINDLLIFCWTHRHGLQLYLLRIFLTTHFIFIFKLFHTG